MRLLGTVAATLAAVALLALLFPYTGLYDVAATSGHGGLERWYLRTLSEHSIAARADAVTVPEGLADSARVRRGAYGYRAMCQRCHGAPGHERAVSGQGLAPQPPSLHEEADAWSSAELFWIVKHGIKMAGMPAYGPTHTDEELWELVAFLEQLPGMAPAQYEALTTTPTADTTAAPAARPVPPGHEGHDHVH